MTPGNTLLQEHVAHFTSKQAQFNNSFNPIRVGLFVQDLYGTHTHIPSNTTYTYICTYMARSKRGFCLQRLNSKTVNLIINMKLLISLVFDGQCNLGPHASHVVPISIHMSWFTDIGVGIPNILLCSLVYNTYTMKRYSYVHHNKQT